MLLYLTYRFWIDNAYLKVVKCVWLSFYESELVHEDNSLFIFSFLDVKTISLIHVIPRDCDCIANYITVDVLNLLDFHNIRDLWNQAVPGDS